jgi:hypothetical protein
MASVYQTGLPRGLRVNNPLNLRHSEIAWHGKAAHQPDSDYVAFEDAHHGIRAAARNLLTYYRKHKLRTVQGIVRRWAPPEDDNDTGSYISRVAQRLNVAADAELDLEDPAILSALVVAMMPEEIGSVPYTEETIATAVAAAYTGTRVVAPLPAAPGVPSPVPVPTAPPGEKPVPPLVDQPTALPTRKVNAIPVGGVFVGIPLAFVLQALWNKAMPDTPMEAEVAIGLAGMISTACAYLFAYFTRNRATLPPPGTCA